MLGQENNNENKVIKFIYNQVSLIFAICGVAFSIYFFLSSPTQENNVALKLADQRITMQQKTIDEITKTQQNDIKEMKNEVAGLRSEIQLLTNNVTALTVIIDERIPYRK